MRMARFFVGFHYCGLSITIGMRKNSGCMVFKRGILMWMLYAGLTALFSALVAILSKLGLQGMNSHFATAVRTTAVMVITWLMVWGVGVKGEAMHINRNQFIYLVLSAIATGGAWICYNRALQDGPATRVASIDKMSIVLIAVLSWLIFKEDLNWTAVVSLVLITGGTVLLIFA